jgi:branched-chain amino acid transport system permease protein
VGWCSACPARIKGFYLMVATLAAQFFLEWLFVKFPWFYNNASSGTITAPRLHLAGLDLSGREAAMLTLACVALLTWAASNLVRSQTAATGWRCATWTPPPR